LNEFQEDLELDPLQLDVAATMQGELFFKWSQRWVVAREAMDRAKLDLDITENELNIDVRRNPDDYGLDKVTEKLAEAAVKASAKYRKKAEQLIEKRKIAGRLEKAVMAMEQRKRMIEVLITLHGQQYFAGPSVPHNLAETWKEAKEKQEKQTLKRQRKKTRKRGEKT